MHSREEEVKPLFHYNYKSDSVILDSKYNYQGSLLAVANSVGELHFYSESSDFRDPLFSLDRKHLDKKNNAVLKIAWSLPVFSLIATLSICGDITLYECSRNQLKKHKHLLVLHAVPLSVAFCPIQTKAVVTVGWSNGGVVFYNQNLQVIVKVEAHEEAVNSLSWEHHILSYEKNKWIAANFEHVHKFMKGSKTQRLATGSSDGYLKIWQLDSTLHQLASVKAHSKPIRQVQWKPCYLADSEQLLITCSEDGYVKIWSIRTLGNNLLLENRGERNFMGPVFKVQYNFLGNLVAVSYANEIEERVQTIVAKEVDGVLSQQIHFSLH